MRLYPLSSLSYDVPVKVSVDAKEEWLGHILTELNEEAGEEEEMMIEQTFLEFKGEIKKSKNDKFGEFVLCEGEIKSTFVTQCVSTGEMIFDHIDCEIQSASLNKKLSEYLGLEEGDTVFIEDSEQELYFYEKGSFDLEPVLNEFVFLNKNPYPKKHPDNDETPTGSSSNLLN